MSHLPPQRSVAQGGVVGREILGAVHPPLDVVERFLRTEARRRVVRVDESRVEELAAAERPVIKAGGESRVIDLEGGHRVIKKVEFWYDAQTTRRGKKSVVRLFGRR